MKGAYFFILTIFTTFILVGCAANESVKENTNKEKFLKFEVLEEYEIDKTIIDSGLNTPDTIVYYKNMLLISDTSNNCIKLFDLDGNIYKVMGKTGNGDSEFVRPTEIFTKGDEIYVSDSGNKRIQIFGEDLNFKEKIDLKKYLVEDVDILDIVVDESDNIYFSVKTTIKKNAVIYKIDKERKITTIGENLYGHLAIINNEVYFSGELELFQEDKVMGAQSGNCEFLKISDNEVVKISEMPYKYVAKSIIYKEDYVYFLSGAYSSIDRFDLYGNYLGTVFKGDLNDYKGIESLAFDDNNNIYVCSTEKGEVYRLVKKEILNEGD